MEESFKIDFDNLDNPVEYVGFWVRFVTFLVDSLIVAVIIIPLLLWIYGVNAFFDLKTMTGPVNILLNYVLPAIAFILFWIYRSATPGKMLLDAIIVDARGGGKPSKRQLVLRYLGYYLSTLPLFLGFFWIMWDPRKQGWHDKLAHTVVVYKRAVEET